MNDGLTVTGVPESIPRSRLIALLAELGIDAREVTRAGGIRIDWQGITCEVFARDEHGNRYAVDDRAATHRITIRIEDDE